MQLPACQRDTGRQRQNLWQPCGLRAHHRLPDAVWAVADCAASCSSSARSGAGPSKLWLQQALRHTWCMQRCMDGGLCCIADGNDDGEQGEESGRAASVRAAKGSSPSSTLEASFDSLNVKKLDLTFAMDPLFRRTSAQFDEGGARGSLELHKHTLEGASVSQAVQGITRCAARRSAAQHAERV